MGLIDDLGTGRVGVDTAIFIYFIEETPAWLPLVRSLFLAADSGRLELVTSAITLPEVLVVPFFGPTTTSLPVAMMHCSHAAERFDWST